MNNKNNTHSKLNKSILLPIILMVAILLNSNVFCQIHSISPTIDSLIYTDQWQQAGYPGRITSDNPIVEEEIIVAEPTGNRVKTIFKY